MAILKRCILFLLVLTPISGSAQNSTATLTGQVMDASGAALPGVTVTLSSPNTGGASMTSVTDQQGTYRFNLSQAGTYKAQFELAGFRTLIIESIPVILGADRTVNATLQITPALSIPNPGVAPAPVVDPGSATVAFDWNDHLIHSIPIGRSATAIVALSPGMNQLRTYGRSGSEFTVTDGTPILTSSLVDFGALQEVQFIGAAKSAETPTSGPYINLSLKSGGNTYHGSVYADWQDERFQSNNVTQNLLDRSFVSPGNAPFRNKEVHADAGGRIIRDKLWFYGSYRNMYAETATQGFVDANSNPVTFYNRVYDYLLKLTYQVNAKNRLDVMGALHREWQPFTGASVLVPAESTQNRDKRNLTGPKLSWAWVPSAQTVVEATGSRWGWWWPQFPHTSEVRRFDNTTARTRGAALSQYNRLSRWQWNIAASHIAQLAGATHEIKSGVTGWRYTNLTETRGYPNQQQYIYRSLFSDTNYLLRPDSVFVYEYPTRTTTEETWQSWYLNDRWRVRRNLTLTLGLRFDRYQNSYPEQTSSGAGFVLFAPKVVVPARTLPAFNNWEPRISFAYALTGSGTLVLKGSYGRYYNDPADTVAAAVIPSFSVTYRFANWNGSIPYVPVTQNLSTVSTSGSADRDIIAPLKNSFTDEYTAGLDYGIRRDASLRVNFIRKRDRQGRVLVNTAQPFEAFTDVRTANDPGLDNITGTPDDRSVPVYSVPTTYPGFGRLVSRLINVPGAGNEMYSSIETTFNKRFSDRWSLLASYQADFLKVRGGGPLTPNELLYPTTAPFWDHAVRLVGTYDLPLRFQYGSVFTVRSGEPYGRSISAFNALGSIVSLTVEPIAGYYPWVKAWDNRISKSLHLYHDHSVEFIFDVFNTLNSSTLLTQSTANGSTYLRPTQIVPPRIFRIAGKWSF